MTSNSAGSKPPSLYPTSRPLSHSVKADFTASKWRKTRRPRHDSGTVNVRRYEPTGLSSEGGNGGVAGNGWWTLRNTGWPKPSISQFDGTGIVLQRRSSKAGSWNRAGADSGVGDQWKRQVPFSDRVKGDWPLSPASASSTVPNGTKVARGASTPHIDTAGSSQGLGEVPAAPGPGNPAVEASTCGSPVVPVTRRASAGAASGGVRRADATNVERTASTAMARSRGVVVMGGGSVLAGAGRR